VLSTTAQYALRALGSLAAQESGGVVLGRDLAQQSGVPANYLSKILLVLNRAGLVEATRGTGGGYRLARPAAEISLQEIVDPVDNLARLDDCIMGLDECSERDPCAMHEWWKQVREGYLRMLLETSLADVKARQGPESLMETEGDG
jgi:Rrf2 family iron-sulfur cluster assembly transcriptional regulator